MLKNLTPSVPLIKLKKEIQNFWQESVKTVKLITSLNMKNNKIYTKSVLQHHVYTRLHRTKSNPPISTIITKFRPTADLNRTNKP